MHTKDIKVSSESELGSSTFEACRLASIYSYYDSKTRKFYENAAKRLFQDVAMTYPLVKDHDPKLTYVRADPSKFRHRDSYVIMLDPVTERYTTTLRELQQTISNAMEGIECMLRVAHEDEEEAELARLEVEKKKRAAAEKRAQKAAERVAKQVAVAADRYRDDTGRPL